MCENAAPSSPLQLTHLIHHSAPRHNAQNFCKFSTSTSMPLIPDARRRFASSISPEGTATTMAPENPFHDGMLGTSREDCPLHEHSFLQGAEARGRLSRPGSRSAQQPCHLVDQRTMLKGMQHRLRDAANTLGLSRDVIGWIDRRRCAPSPKSLSHQFCVGLIVDPSYSTQDLYIFWAAAVFKSITEAVTSSPNL